MERKRKLPPRAAARMENEAKRRQSTPREPSEEPPPAPVVEELPPAPPPLPRSVQAGKPLPTVEDAQPDDLSAKEYQSVGESGVLSESLARSRHKWVSEGLFEKYWSKPHKKKGVVHEEPKNPPKDSMTKVGTVTITIEPHIIEATMFVVKDPNAKQKQQQQKQPKQQKHQQAQPDQPPARPILQYGPPNGSMPPPPAPKSTTSSPAPDPAHSKLAAASPTHNPKPPPSTSSGSTHSTKQEPSKIAAPQVSGNPTSTTAAPAAAPPPSYPPRPPTAPMMTAPAPHAHTNQATITNAAPVTQPPPPPPASTITTPAGSPAGVRSGHTPAHTPTSSASQPPQPQHAPSPAHAPPQGTAKPPAPTPGSSAAPPPAAKPATNDPVIALLAQKASGDPELRDLMKRVAMGQAKQAELNHFQGIINQLNAEYKRGGGQQGPSADRLLVDGRTVRYFADEVCAILDIVLASNPNQRASDLRPPPRSDPLVVLVVKTALEDKRTKDMCRRIATGKPGYTDATDLKEILDRLHRDSKILPPPTAPPAQAAPPAAANRAPNGLQNGASAAAGPNQSNQQAIRAKSSLPPPKPDISAVVFDFGTGDRYLFPKFSILEYLPTTSGQKVIASFLIVRKGSLSEYGGVPELDYYQPATMRLYTPNGRHLENLARVVAPQDEVRRYMDDVMDHMTRAEYILLAMRLPRVPREEAEPAAGRVIEDSKTARSTPLAEKEAERPPPSKPSVLWITNTSGSSTPPNGSRAVKSKEAEDETHAQYMRLINSVAAKESAAT